MYIDPVTLGLDRVLITSCVMKTNLECSQYVFFVKFVNFLYLRFQNVLKKNCSGSLYS